MLSKGFEIEIYTGKPTGDIVGLSDRITADLEGFMREPDARNVEYVTEPLTSYERLLCGLVRPRQKLRAYLHRLGDYTLIPGSTLSLEGSEKFYRSDPSNSYHDYIEQTYGTKVVTASVHINVGISDPETLMRAVRLVRVEAPLYLALSAASPFVNGKATGYHSSRWQLFPKVPAQAPLFRNHAHFIRWTNAQLETGTMQSVRHFWTSVRPNGSRRPYDLNRLELRTCDLIVDPVALLAVTALLEARIMQLIDDPSLDPLTNSSLSPTELIALTDANEAAAAKSSLDAQLQHWQDGSKIGAREWIEAIYGEVMPIAKKQGFSCFLAPVQKILQSGNTAEQWLRLHSLGLSPRQIIIGAIAAVAEREKELEDQLCQSLVW